MHAAATLGPETARFREPPVVMPRQCRGRQAPNSGAYRPCIFAADGKGGASDLPRWHSDLSCAFCSLEAFERVMRSPKGNAHLIKRLQAWREAGSPTYKAVFDFGIPGLFLDDAAQWKLRRRAGERPSFKLEWSWLNKKRSRLRAFLCGKPVPPAPELTPAAKQFLEACLHAKLSKVGLCTAEHRALVRRFVQSRRRALDSKGPKQKYWRRKWWQLRRCIQSSMGCAIEAGPPFPPIVDWAKDEGLV